MRVVTSAGKRRSALFAILMSAMMARAECSLQALSARGSEVRAGAATLNLGEPDNAIAPVAWQGPLRAGACSVDLGIIEAPLMLAPDNLLYVPSYSGSVRTLTLVDLVTCSVRWKSMTFTGILKIGPRALQLGRKRIALDARCVPATRK
jgi:hypothetical protein